MRCVSLPKHAPYGFRWVDGKVVDFRQKILPGVGRFSEYSFRRMLTQMINRVARETKFHAVQILLCVIRRPPKTPLFRGTRCTRQIVVYPH